VVPRLWSDTIEEHRREVRQSILDTTWRLATDKGIRAVTMSEVAAQVGIGRATLYKYFSNVEAILDARHEQHVCEHLAQLSRLSEQSGEPVERLSRVLEGYARIRFHRERQGPGEILAHVHRQSAVESAEAQVRRLMQDLIQAAVDVGALADVGTADELASYCVHALGAAGEMPSEDSVARLVAITLAGLQQAS
jgi:AcrR family transcriptional regulator